MCCDTKPLTWKFQIGLFEDHSMEHPRCSSKRCRVPHVYDWSRSQPLAPWNHWNRHQELAKGQLELVLEIIAADLDQG